MTTWESRAADKRARLAATIPPEWRIPATDAVSVMDIPRTSGILSEKELQITESFASDLVKSLAEGKISAVEVTTAFCKRAALAMQVVRTPIPIYDCN